MADVRISFTMNEAYFRAFHGEWIAVVGRGWRADRIMIPISALLNDGDGIQIGNVGYSICMSP